MDNNNNYDVIILGSGIAGTALASILAKQDHRVLVIEKNSHPRFAIGESLLPQSAMWLWILGNRFDVPEITNIAHIDTIISEITTASGVKTTLGFAYHRDGEEQNPKESHKLIPPEIPFAQETHLFRQDVDWYMLEAARKYGVEYRDHTTVTNIEFDDDGVTLATEAGDTFRGRFFVDGAGFRSPVAQKYGLRDSPSKFRTHSRTIFNHFTNMRPYDEVLPAGSYEELSHTWHEGTLHHVFDGGWFWVIPFDNHEDASNQRASIGLTLDLEKYPARDDITPEEEFWEFVNRFPSIAQHFEGIQPVQHYIGTKRLQYSSSTSVGDRYFLLNHAYGFTDPLYSRGMISSFQVIHAFTSRLLDALDQDDFAPGTFEFVDMLQKKLATDADQMNYNAYRAMKHYDTWNAWTHLWLATKLYGDIWMVRAILKFVHSGGDVRHLDNLNQDNFPTLGVAYATEMQEFVDAHEMFLDKVEAGDLTPEAAGEKMFRVLKDTRILPHHVWGWGDAADNNVDFKPGYMLPAVVLWGKTLAPKHLRTGFFDFPVSTLIKMQIAKMKEDKAREGKITPSRSLVLKPVGERS